MLLTIEKSGECDKEYSTEWLVNKDPGKWLKNLQFQLLTDRARKLAEQKPKFNGNKISLSIRKKQLRTLGSEGSSLKSFRMILLSSTLDLTRNVIPAAAPLCHVFANKYIDNIYFVLILLQVHQGSYKTRLRKRRQPLPNQVCNHCREYGNVY